MNDDKDFSGPKVFKLISGEEIVATINRTTDNQFLIEMPLEIKYNPDDSSVYLTKWCLGTDYTTVMTLSSHSIIFPIFYNITKVVLELFSCNLYIIC